MGSTSSFSENFDLRTLLRYLHFNYPSHQSIYQVKLCEFQWPLPLGKKQKHKNVCKEKLSSFNCDPWSSHSLSINATPSGEKLFTPWGVGVRDRDGQKWTRVEFHGYNNGKDAARFMDSQRHELYFFIDSFGRFYIILQVIYTFYNCSIWGEI